MFNRNLINTIQSNCNFSSKMISLSTDTRSYCSEELFICLTGDSFDGFDFVEQVLDKGCKIIAFKETQKNIEKKNSLSKEYKNVSFISCADTVLFLQELAKQRVLEFKKDGNDIFGITGSNGKTTTKEMLASLLQAVFNDQVFATIGNLNNHIGVPLTILSAPIECKKLIVEMGSNHLGEISQLCEIANPEFGIISNVGAAHIGLFGNIDNIYKEKKSLFDYVYKKKSSRSKFIINQSDKYLSRIESNSTLVGFGGEDSKYQISFHSNSFNFLFKGKEIVCENVNIFEKYNLQNLASALIMCLEVYPEKADSFILAARKYKLPALNRSEWLKINEIEIFLDAYNANPTSMSSSINSFNENIQRKGLKMSEVLYVLGDMNELGDYTKSEHEKIGQLLTEIGAKSVCFVGNFTKYYKNSFPSGMAYLSKSSLEEEWPTLSKGYKVIFIKASRSLQLESLIDIT